MARSSHNPELYTMSFGDHLDDLRRRLILALIPPIPLIFVMFSFANTFLAWICAPLIRVLRNNNLPETLQVLAPIETFLVYLKISIIAALIVSGPWMLWQLWRFVQPGLYHDERRFVYFLLPGSVILTTCGILLLYYVMLPIVLIFLVGFGANISFEKAVEIPPVPIVEMTTPPTSLPILSGRPEPLEPGMMWLTPDHDLQVAVRQGDSIIVRGVRLHSTPVIAQTFQLTAYVNFVILLTLGMVIAFQMPLVILLLGWVGLVTPTFLRTYRRHAIFILAIISMFLTPADPWSMIIMLVPMYALYELGIVLLVFAPAKKIAAGTVFSKEDKEAGDDDATDPDDERERPWSDSPPQGVNNPWDSMGTTSSDENSPERGDAPSDEAGPTPRGEGDARSGSE